MTVYDMFSDEMKSILMRSIEYWKSKNIKSFATEHLLYTMIKEKNPVCLNVLNHFKCDVNKICKDIEDDNFEIKVINKSTKSSIGINFDESVKSCISTAANYSMKEDPMNPEVTIQTYFLAMCITPESKLCAYFNDKGISEEVIKDYFIENNDIIDKLKKLYEDDNDDENGIVGKGSSDDAIDTLERPVDGEDNNPKDPNITKTKTKNSKKSKILQMFSTDYIENVKKGRIGNIIGRNKEIDLLMEILCRKNKRNAMLLGDPGVGKTALVEGLAVEIYNNRVPLPLKNKSLVELDVSALVAGTRYRGDFEERVKMIMNELISSRNVILFIDEIHTLLGAGGSIGGLDLGNMLKPALARGDIQVIGATTQDEYQKFILTDGALERRFQTIQVREPSLETAEEILSGLKESFENYHNVEIDRSALNAAVRLSEQYVPQRYLPDKCIDIIDQAGARSHMRTKNFPDDIIQLQKELERIIRLKDDSARKENYSAAQKYHNKEMELQVKIEKRENEYFESIKDQKVIITDKEVAEVISSLTEIPTSKLNEDDADRLLNLENVLKEKVVGQNDAVSQVCKAIRRARTDMHDKKKPIGNFLCIGPTGVGKTELARQLALELFGKEENLLKFDMSEYSEKFDVSKLLGSAPGFVGYEEGGKLTEAVRKTPYAVVLFDEIEKAHKDIYNIFLQLMEDGMVTDSKGRQVYFNNCIILMTSNIGAEKAYQSKHIGYGDVNNISEAIKVMKKEAENYFRPEFLNRLDDIIIFNQLNHDSISKIIDLSMAKLNSRIKHRNIIFKITNDMREHIIKEGYSEKYGARPINRAIQSIIEDYSADKLLRKEFNDGMTIEFDYKDEKVVHNIIENRSENDNSKDTASYNINDNGTFEKVYNSANDDDFTQMLMNNLK